MLRGRPGFAPARPTRTVRERYDEGVRVVPHTPPLARVPGGVAKALPRPAGGTRATLRWWQWPTVLSLDAPLVTVAWQRLIAGEAGVRLAWYHSVIVGASVWLAYAADRWLEGLRVPPARFATERHRFYHHHRRATAIVWGMVLVATVALSVMRLSARELAAGGALLVPTLAYLLSHQLVHRTWPGRAPKELCVAALVAAAAALFPFADAPSNPLHLVDAAIWFCLLALANCALISRWEQDVDRLHGQDSLVRSHGAIAPLVRAMPWALAVAAALLLAAGRGGAVGVRTAAATSALLLGVIDRSEPRLGWQASRVLADLSLLTPFLFLTWRS